MTSQYSPMRQFDLIDELQYQSNQVFEKIERLLPIPDQGKADISFLQKVKWNFTKSKVALLVGELDYLRSTVHLLVTIIFTGRKLRSHSRKLKPLLKGTPNYDNDIGKQGIKAQNALLAQHEAQEEVSRLEQQVSQQSNAGNNQPSTSTAIICTEAMVLANLQQALAIYTDPAERQRVVLQDSARILRQLLQQWTNVDQSLVEDPLSEGHVQSTNSKRQDATIGSPQWIDGVAETRPPQPSDAETPRQGHRIVTPHEINKRFSQTSKISTSSEQEGTTAPGHLENRPRVLQEKELDLNNPKPEFSNKLTIDVPFRGWTRRWNSDNGFYDYFYKDGLKATRVVGSDLENLGWTKHWNPISGYFVYYSPTDLCVATKTMFGTFMLDLETIRNPQSSNAKTIMERMNSSTKPDSARRRTATSPIGPWPRTGRDTYDEADRKVRNESQEKTAHKFNAFTRESQGLWDRTKFDEARREAERVFPSFVPTSSTSKVPPPPSPPPPRPRRSTPRAFPTDERAFSGRRETSFSTTCRTCDGVGGRSDKFQNCQACERFMYRDGRWTTDPRRTLKLLKSCQECYGKGRTIKEKYRCKECNGTGNLPLQSPSQ